MPDLAKLHVEFWIARVAVVAGMALAFAMVLAFLGPFGTEGYDAFQRIGYWTFCMAAWVVLTEALARPIARRLLKPHPRRGRLLVFSTLIASLPMIAVTIAATMAMADWYPYPSELVEQVIGIWLIGGTYNYLCDRLINTMHGATAGSATQSLQIEPEDSCSDAATVQEHALFDRLPAHLGRQILCLQVEDHYVRVHTSHGNALILTRFSDALLSVTSVPGLRIHRSWWVASEAITSLRRTGRTAEVSLSNGITAPVSQPYLADVTAVWDASARQPA